MSRYKHRVLPPDRSSSSSSKNHHFGISPPFVSLGPGANNVTAGWLKSSMKLCLHRTASVCNADSGSQGVKESRDPKHTRLNTYLLSRPNKIPHVSSPTHNFPAFKTPYSTSVLFLWLQCGPVVTGLLFCSLSAQHWAVPDGLHGPHSTCFDCFQEELQVWTPLRRCYNWDYKRWSTASVLPGNASTGAPPTGLFSPEALAFCQSLQNPNQLSFSQLLSANTGFSRILSLHDVTKVQIPRSHV